MKSLFGKRYLVDLDGIGCLFVRRARAIAFAREAGVDSVVDRDTNTRISVR